MTRKLSLFTEIGYIENDNLSKSDSLLHVFEDIHNHIYANDGLSSQEVFIEMLDVLFVKIFDEKFSSNKGFYIKPSEYELLLKNGKSEGFLKRFRSLFGKTADYFSDVIDKKRGIKLKLSTLGYIVNKLQVINLSESSSDVKGIAFQKFLYSKQRGDRGQFFTPEQIVFLCQHFLKPSIDDYILDPACGSGGFLTEAVKYVIKNNTKSNEIILEYFIRHNIVGIEINKLAAKVAKMRMLLEHGIYSNICIADSLSDWSILNMKLAKVLENGGSFEGKFDIILTNPPFGTKGKIRDESFLRRFSLGHKWVKKSNDFYSTDKVQNGQVPDILFIERCIDFLKDNGKMAIVLPNGIFENPSLEYVRSYIKRRARLLAVVKLPYETFVPFGTGIKASLLFIQKLPNSRKQKKEEIDSSIFFGNINRLGYMGTKNGSVVYLKDEKGHFIKDSKGQRVVDEDISDVIADYNNYNNLGNFRENEDRFLIKSSDCKSRFDYDFYKPSYRKLENIMKNSSKELGDVVDIIKRVVIKREYEGKQVEYVELADISSEYLEITNSSLMLYHELPSRASYILREGDIVTAIAGNSIGTYKHMSALVTKSFDGAIATNGLRILKPKGNLDPYYLLYFLRTDLFLKQILRYRTGAAIPAVSDDDLLKIRIFLPSKKTQEYIAIRVKESFKLRKESRELLNNIDLSLNI